MGLQWQVRVTNWAQSWIVRCKIKDKDIKMMKTVTLSSPKVNMIIALLIKTITSAILTNIRSLTTVVATSPSIAQMISMTIIGKNSVTWSAINILYSRNIEAGKFYMSTITEEREKSKELQDKLSTEKIIEVERLKGEIKVLKLLNDNLIKENTPRSAAMRFESAALTTEEWSQPRRTSCHNTPQTAHDIQTGNQYQLLENCDDDDSLEETKTPFEID